MPSQKRSLAEFRTARFNPIHADEKQVLEIIRGLEQQGYSFKKIAVDAILRANNALFQHEQSDLSRIEKMLAEFAEKLSTRETTNNKPVSTPDSAFVRDFARGFIARSPDVPDTDDVTYEDIEE